MKKETSDLFDNLVDEAEFNGVLKEHPEESDLDLDSVELFSGLTDTRDIYNLLNKRGLL